LLPRARVSQSTKRHLDRFSHFCRDHERNQPTDRQTVEFESATRRKERLEYEKWKNERRIVDVERIQRTKDDAGRWKREWDQHKPVIG